MVKFIDAEVKPMLECWFCGYPLIKAYYSVDEKEFCKKQCIKEYFATEEFPANKIVIRDKETVH